MDELAIRQQRFTEAMVSQHQWLHRFFSIGLSSVQGDKETMIKDMMQETALKAWINYRKPKYAEKSPLWLIKQKAKNVLSEKLEELKKKLPVNSLIGSTEKNFTPSFQQELEDRDILKYIYENSEDALGYAICSLLVAGYSHEEIKKILPNTKETKMKLSRFRKEIRAKGHLRD
jgi:DNA-directed RNA polymerase specialized sigma24 family protein